MSFFRGVVPTTPLHRHDAMSSSSSPWRSRIPTGNCVLCARVEFRWQDPRQGAGVEASQPLLYTCARCRDRQMQVRKAAAFTALHRWRFPVEVFEYLYAQDSALRFHRRSTWDMFLGGISSTGPITNNVLAKCEQNLMFQNWHGDVWRAGRVYRVRDWKMRTELFERIDRYLI